MTINSNEKKVAQSGSERNCSNSSPKEDDSCRKKSGDRKNVEKHPQNDTNSYWLRTGKQLTAGALSGWCDASITYPTEYVKVMLQLQEKGKEKRFANATDVVRQTIRYHGLLGMYRGFSVVFIGNVPKYKTLMLGMEIRVKVSDYGMDRGKALRVQHEGQYRNINCIRSNAMKYLPNFFRKGQLSKIFFIFPDPHFKKQKHKWRIISSTLLSKYAYFFRCKGAVRVDV